MPNQNWKNATQAYSWDDIKPPQPSTAASTEAMTKAIFREEQERKNAEEVAEGLHEFHSFMKEEAPDAIPLLQASDHYITLAVESDGGGVAKIYFIDGRGLRSEVVNAHLSAAYAAMKHYGPLSDASIPCTPAEIFLATIQHAGLKPGEVVGWLRNELDKIASNAPGKVA